MDRTVETATGPADLFDTAGVIEQVFARYFGGGSFPVQPNLFGGIFQVLFSLPVPFFQAFQAGYWVLRELLESRYFPEPRFTVRQRQPVVPPGLQAGDFGPAGVEPGKLCVGLGQLVRNLVLAVDQAAVLIRVPQHCL